MENIKKNNAKILDRLLASEETMVRAELAKQGYKLDVLVNDDSWIVRCEVAKQGYGLDILVKDKNSYVRYEVANKTNDINLLHRLSQDPYFPVSNEAKKRLRLLGYESEIEEIKEENVRSIDTVVDDIGELEQSLKREKEFLANLAEIQYVSFDTLRSIHQISEEIAIKKIVNMFPRFAVTSVSNAFTPSALAEELKGKTNFTLFSVKETSIYVVFHWDSSLFKSEYISIYAPTFSDDIVDEKKVKVERTISSFLYSYNKEIEYGKHLQWLYETQKGDFIDKAIATFPNNNWFIATIKYIFRPSYRKKLKEQIPVYEQLVKEDKENTIAEYRKSIERKREEVEAIKKQIFSVAKELFESDIYNSFATEYFLKRIKVYEYYMDICGHNHIIYHNMYYNDGNVSL